MLARLRRSLAAAICPELARTKVEVGVAPARPAGGSERNVISGLLILTDAFQFATALSDWEVARRAGVNNRAIIILRRGSPVAPRTAARLFEFFEEAWPVGMVWPLDSETNALFGTILTIPAIEMVGGIEAMHELVRASGRKRTKGAIQAWAARSGMPEYARHLAMMECARLGVTVSAKDFESARLSPRQIVDLQRLTLAGGAA